MVSAREAALKARGVKPRLARRPHKTHPQLSPRFERYNRLIARRRSAVETTFATWKRRMGLTAIRYRGLIKTEAQVLLAAMAFNLSRGLYARRPERVRTPSNRVQRRKSSQQSIQTARR